jgi:hypothetical protein
MAYRVGYMTNKYAVNSTQRFGRQEPQDKKTIWPTPNQSCNVNQRLPKK